LVLFFNGKYPAFYRAVNKEFLLSKKQDEV